MIRCRDTEYSNDDDSGGAGQRDVAALFRVCLLHDTIWEWCGGAVLNGERGRGPEESGLKQIVLDPAVHD